MSLWDLLTFVCCAMPIGGALASAKYANVGFGLDTLAIAIGLAVGVSCAWIMRTVGDTVAVRINRLAVSRHERYFHSLYFGAVARLRCSSGDGSPWPFCGSLSEEASTAARQSTASVAAARLRFCRVGHRLLLCGTGRSILNPLVARIS
jgi:hypothetical protein